MKIGLFTDAYLPEISGVTILVRRLRDELARLGHTVYVYAPKYDEPSDDEERVFRYRAGPVFSYRTARMAVPYSREATKSFSELDVVHSHTPFSLAYAAFTAAYRHRLPHVQTYHTYLSQYRHYVPRVFRPSVRGAERYSALLCNRCTVITVPTSSIRDELVRFGVRRSIHVLPFGPDVRHYAATPTWDVRGTLGIAPEAPLCMYAGRLAEEKNLDFVLRSFGKIHLQIPEAQMVFSGDGPSRAGLEARAASMGLSGAVHFAGFLSQERLIDMYKAADLFLFASKSETQGLVLVEAMAGRTPAVAVRAQGVCDVVENERNGYLVPEDEDALAAQAVEILTSPDLHERLCEGALESAAEVSVEASTERLVKIYERCYSKALTSRTFMRPRLRLRRAGKRTTKKRRYS